ncbi:glutamate N-acetyltransferase/amino-acid N-acetyltransferase [Cryobacterium mesophilum]|uniref:Arginine biosynthesis bifunctional protein ArgJ n=1 Tax=Terrimesophilobacter mesophilus TaxID=433647 RepID=A0A4R8VA80_9MICO|nr:bifunctional glutamate N-acetyltransferase/amino-acid acetyltransferase ArgJ [Terrimesophilobacter mesophilus]MBB5632120.1 glutamate N-acetyltransferase/amino-acid N-acetyltransferase [Terrimesophilobacter mesophilus]TFB78990.1 bifunctional glutamate N-acetyltransferase/amino-acid acetyltransferase ArgJ [Terrimesophilobacter mesophilus]
MSVTAAAGFEAAGVSAGLKSSGGLDVALVVNRGPLASAAAVFTSNRSKANPILWSQQVMADPVVSAILLNSGGANCFTGHEGFQTVHASAEAVADALRVSAGDVLVCSTGLIGEQLDRVRMMAGIDQAAAALDAHGGTAAARAIMTTDTVPKLGVHAADGWVVGGMAKGAGMLAPALATMLVVLTTDAVLDSSQLDAALREAVRTTFDRLDSDGCMSTNDQVTLLASGASGIRPDLDAFTAALTDVCAELARQLMADAEGADHEITITVAGAASESDAEEVGRAIARSNLFKAAVFGNDPNWGRVLAAIGTTSAEFDPYNVDVRMNGVRVCHEGGPDAPRERVDLAPRALLVELDLFVGAHSATILTNDLTHAYVHENSAYAS